MSKDNKFFEDLFKVAGSAIDSAFTSVGDMKSRFEEMVKQSIENYSKKVNMVTREEFEIVKEMASKARAENEALKKRLDKLEGKTKNTKKKQ